MDAAPVTPERSEVEVFARVWARRASVERYEGLVAVESVALHGVYPHTTIEVCWRDLMSTSGATDRLEYPIWHKWKAPDEIDADYIAEDVIEDVFLRAIGD